MGDIPSLLLVAFGVGIVIGLTGMGGGALMTPALVFLGVPPTAAVANDLVAAAVNKTVGAAVHLRDGSPHTRLAKWLVLGSVPTAFAGAWIVDAFGSGEVQESRLKTVIAVTLLFAAATYAIRIAIQVRRSAIDPHARDVDDEPQLRRLRTLLIGAVGGLLVGITSVGSGSVIMVALLLLYPALSARRLVGTDLVQAIPLVVAAAISHVIVTGVDLSVLLPLIAGGAPGTYLGARASGWVSQSVVRSGITTVLTLSGLALFGVPPVWVGIIGAALITLGPLAWACFRHLVGLPAFTHPPTTDTGLEGSDTSGRAASSDTSDRL